MANLSNIARPYALAAFECAKEKGELPSWKAFLSSCSQVASEPSVKRIIANPETLPSELFALFQGVLQSELNTERRNFLQLISQNRRLMVLPEIADAFNIFCEQLEQITQVRVVTAVKATDDFKAKLKDALARRIKRDVTLQCELDPSIIGGAIIHMGDNVIDGSIRGKLTRLLEFSLR